MPEQRHQEAVNVEQWETEPQPGGWADQNNLQILQAKLQELTARYQLPVPALARILHVSPAWVTTTLRRWSRPILREDQTYAP